MLVVINKIITKYKTDDNGNLILSPIKERPIPDGFKVEQESIRVDEIKAVRSWHKSDRQSDIEGDICAVYMLDQNRGSSDPKRENRKPAEIHINESFESFNKRIGAILLEV